MLEQIMGAVRECSKIILEAENIQNATSSKLGHANFVTKYDKCVQQELFERLGKILPKAAFMGGGSGKTFYKRRVSLCGRPN